jgi:hypothetical protein
MSRKFLGSRKEASIWDKTLSVNIVRVELNLIGLPNNAVHMSGFLGEDGRIVELNAVSLVDTVFSYGRLVRMF